MLMDLSIETFFRDAYQSFVTDKDFLKQHNANSLFKVNIKDTLGETFIAFINDFEMVFTQGVTFVGDEGGCYHQI